MRHLTIGLTALYVLVAHDSGFTLLGDSDVNGVGVQHKARKLLFQVLREIEVLQVYGGFEFLFVRLRGVKHGGPFQ